MLLPASCLVACQRVGEPADLRLLPRLEDGLRFYSYGIRPNHDNSMARRHAEAWASKKRREDIARKMFLFRFVDVEVSSSTIQQLRGMEGRRVKFTYERLGLEFVVTWKGRDYKLEKWDLADGINRALSATNASLYALPRRCA